jgi:iron complex outermembrane receptor protein
MYSRALSVLTRPGTASPIMILAIIARKDNRTYNELGLMPDGTYYKDQVDNYQQNHAQLLV